MVNSFSQFLVEEDKTVYFTFGRMNPPTIGHEKLINALSLKSGRNPYRVYLSQTQDKNKNPLDYNTKVKTARKFFPKHARSIMLDRKIKTVFNALVKLYTEGFKNIVMIVGSDRVNEFDILLNKYNNKRGPHGLYSFRNINIVSAGSRDPDSEGVEGMSASKMRAAAKDNNFTSFSQGLPRTVSNLEAKKLFNSIRSGMGLKEQKEFKNHVQLKPLSEIRENYVQGNLYNPGDVVVDKDTGEICRVKHLGSNYVIVEGSSNQYRKWIDSIEKMDNAVDEIQVASYSMPKEGIVEQTLNESAMQRFKNFEAKDTHKTKDGKTATKGLWYNINQRKKKGLPPKKPGDKGYPKTLDIESKEVK